MSVLRSSEGKDRQESGALRILNLEDSPLDAELVRAQLSEGGIACELVRVQTRADFAAALEEGGFNLILADHSLPNFDGFSALELAQKISPELPFILVSGTLGEELAIEALKSGATDYVLKHRMEQLVPAVRRATREAEERAERERAQAALRESEERFRALVQYGSDIVTVLEADGTIRYQSPSIERVLGYTPEELVGKNAFDNIHPEDIEPALSRFAEVLTERGATVRAEFRFRHADGSWRYIEGIGNNLLDDPSVRGIVVTSRDITERKRTEEALIESEQRFRQLFEQSIDALFVHDEEGRLVDCNAQACRSLGYTREELLKLSVKDFATNLLSEEEKKAKRGDTLWEQTMRGEPGKILGFDENELRRKDGTTFPVEVGVSAIDYGGRRLIFASARDLTERKQTEEELRRSEERFRVTFEHATVGMAHVGLDGRWLRVNEKLCEIVGYRRDELLKKTFQDITHPDDLDADLVGYTRQLLAGGIGSFSTEKRYFRKDSSVVWVNLTVSLVRGPTRDPKYFITVIEDVTARKRAEEALKQSEELYRSVIEQAAENILIMDIQTRRIIAANAAAQRSLGYAPEELKQLTIYDIVAHDRESVDLNIGRIVEQGRYFIGERRYRRKDGSLVDVEVNVSTVAYGGREAMCIVAHDVTERKRAEQNLRQSLSVLLSLREAGQILGSTLSSEEIISRMLEIMRGVSHLTAAIISVPTEDGTLRVWQSAGLGELRHGARFEREAEAARRATLEDENTHLFRLHGSGTQDSHLVGLCLPLSIKDRVFGVLEAYGKESLADTDTIEILSSLTSQAASALENARLYEELEERERALQDLVEKLLRAQEEERRRVAYEVHDELAQVAVAAHQRLQAFARRHSPGTERGRRDLERILRLVRATVTDARRIIANLRPTILDDLGLAAALSLEVERLREDGYHVDYQESLGDERLPDPVEITLFRVAQEALTNLRKHAQTRQVRIQLQRQGKQARLEVRDHGRGFDPDAVFESGSGPGERVGLAGLRERVGMLGGELEIDSRRGGGTSVAATVPLTRAS